MACRAEPAGTQTCRSFCKARTKAFQKSRRPTTATMNVSGSFCCELRNVFLTIRASLASSGQRDVQDLQDPRESVLLQNQGSSTSANESIEGKCPLISSGKPETPVFDILLIILANIMTLRGGPRISDMFSGGRLNGGVVQMRVIHLEGILEVQIHGYERWWVVPVEQQAVVLLPRRTNTEAA